MANRYWVGGTGVWSDNTNHWSETSGGSPGASLPTSDDNMYSDANSFTATGQTVTVDQVGYCLNMDWTGALYNPTFARTAGMINIFGSCTFITAMNMTYDGALSFYATTTGQTITTGGHTFYATWSFNGVGGGWTLQDAVTISAANIYQYAGTLNTNGKAVTCRSFSTSGYAARILNLGASVITCSVLWTASIADLTFDAGTSLIMLTGDNHSFTGGGLTYNIVELQGDFITIANSSTFNDLKLTAGKTYSFRDGTTQTITTLSGDGTSGNLITIQSTSAGSPFTLSKASGTVQKHYYSIKDCTVTGGAGWAAFDSVDAGGNTGWLKTDYLVDENNILQPLNVKVMRDSSIDLMPEPKADTDTIPGRHGEIYFGSKLGARAIELKVLASDFTAEEREDLKHTMAAYLSPIGDAKALVFADDLEKQYMVKYAGKIDPTQYPTWLQFVIPFKSALSYILGSFEEIQIGSGTITNAGNEETPLTIEIAGPVTNPSITIGTYTLIYTGTIDSGSTLIIDVEAMTVKLDGVNAVPDYSGGFPWLSAGNTTVTAASAGTTTFRYRGRWS